MPLNLGATVFPNPFMEQANVVFELPNNLFIDLSLYDMMGKLVKIVDTGFKNKGTYTYTINGTDLPLGTYLLELNTDKGKSISKIIKQ